MADRAPVWPEEALNRRLVKCRVLLYQNGMLTESEMEKIDRRIDRKVTVERGETDFHKRYWTPDPEKADG